MTDPSGSPLEASTPAPMDAASALYASASAASAPDAPPALSAAIMHAAAQAAQARTMAMPTPEASETAAQPMAVLVRYVQGGFKRLSSVLTLPSLRYGLPAMMVAGVAFQVAITSAPKSDQSQAPMATSDAAPSHAAVSAAAPASNAPTVSGAAAKTAPPQAQPQGARIDNPAPASEHAAGASQQPAAGASQQSAARAAAAQPFSTQGFDEPAVLPRSKDAQARSAADKPAVLEQTPSPAPFPQTASVSAHTHAEPNKPAMAMTSGAVDSPKLKAAAKTEAPTDAMAASPARAATPRASAPVAVTMAAQAAATPPSAMASAPAAITASKPASAPVPIPAPAITSAPAPLADAARPSMQSPARALQNPSIGLRKAIVRTTQQQGQLIETCHAQAPTLGQIQALLIDGANPNYLGTRSDAGQTSSTLALAQRCGFTEAAAAMQAAIRATP